MFSGKSDSSLPISLPRPARKGRGMGGLSHPGQRARHRGAQCGDTPAALAASGLAPE